MKRSLVLKSLLVLVVSSVAATLVWAAEPVVLRVVVVQTDDATAYLKEVERGKAIFKRLGSSAEVRVWRARFAGTEAGNVIVSVEFPNLQTFAKDEAAFNADPEFQAWIAGLNRIRKVISDSVYQELRP